MPQWNGACGIITGVTTRTVGAIKKISKSESSSLWINQEVIMEETVVGLQKEKSTALNHVCLLELLLWASVIPTGHNQINMHRMTSIAILYVKWRGFQNSD